MNSYEPLVFSVDGVWVPWSTWEECDVTCGGGLQWRNRTCEGPFYDGAECEGSHIDNRTCNDFPCPGKKERSFNEDLVGDGEVCNNNLFSFKIPNPNSAVGRI